MYDLIKSGHPALDPLVITPDGMLSIKDDVLESSEQLCTILHGHRYNFDDIISGIYIYILEISLSFECFFNSTRLSNLVEQQPRNRKSQRCILHSLEIQRMRPPPNAWREVWECMEYPCQEELAMIEADALDETLDTYLRKHRYNSTHVLQNRIGRLHGVRQ